MSEEEVIAERRRLQLKHDELVLEAQFVQRQLVELAFRCPGHRMVPEWGLGESRCSICGYLD